MELQELRIWGDPLGLDPHGQRLRQFLEQMEQQGRRCSLCLSAVKGESQGQKVALQDGNRQFHVHSSLPGETLRFLMAQAGEEVADSAPLVVFADSLACQQAALEFPLACRVMQVESAAQLASLDLSAALESDLPVPQAARSDLVPYLQLAEPVAGQSPLFLHVTSFAADASANMQQDHWQQGHWQQGTDLLLAAMADWTGPTKPRLRIHTLARSSHQLSTAVTQLPVPTASNSVALLNRSSKPASEGLGRSPCMPKDLRHLAYKSGGKSGLDPDAKEIPELPSPALQAQVEWVAGMPDLQSLAAATAVVQPCRQVPQAGSKPYHLWWQWLLRVMASRRPLLASVYGQTRSVLGDTASCLPIGGRWEAGSFHPHPGMLRDALQLCATEPKKALAQTQRARAVLLQRHVTPRPLPAIAAAQPGTRPLVVLEAPLLENSSSAVLTQETARALLRRQRVDLALLPVPPFKQSLASWQEHAADLLPYLSRRPGPADLWLSTGWPNRGRRPDAHCFVQRFDWEYGAVPMALAPMLTQEADKVVVHSKTVRRSLLSAGRAAQDIEWIPHGVNAQVFHPAAAPLPQVMQFKQGRRVLLFVGGLIWRKGFDLFLKAALSKFCRSDPVCLVIKPMGAADSYHGFHLQELLQRVQAQVQAPETLVLDRFLSAAEMAGMYTASDLLVHPYRGEGFGMPVLEARACGLPVLVTAGGSTDDFCQGGEEQACLSIPSSRRRVDLPGQHIGHPFVLEPDAAALASQLDRSSEQWQHLRSAAIQAAAQVQASHRWDLAAEKIERLAYAAWADRLAHSQPSTVQSQGAALNRR